MKKSTFLFFLLPLLLFAHIKDERLFKTPNIISSATILLDRSGSMDETTYSTQIIVRLNDYAPWDHRDRLVGWYDDEIPTDGPGTMSSFYEERADSLWILWLEWDDNKENRVDMNWVLKIKSNGVWHTFDGGNYSWEGWGYEKRADTILISGLDEVEDIEVYVDITTYYGLDIGEMRVNLIHIPGIMVSTRIKDAIFVIHSLLDANNDGLVNEGDEEYLPVKLGHGFHRATSSSTPGDYSYIYDESYGSAGSNRGESYSQTLRRWVPASSGPLYTDSIGSNFSNLWEHINFTSVGGHTPNGQLIAEGVRYINEWRNKHPDLWCMNHDLILITDGLSNRGTECGGWSSKGSEEVALQAYRAWHEDSIRVYAVGFGTDIEEDGINELNWVARWGGTQNEDSSFIDSMVNIEDMDTLAIDPSYGCPSQDPHKNYLTGYAYIAHNAEALSSALARIFMEIAGVENVSFAAGEVTSVQEEFISTQYQARFYLATFTPDTMPIWEGDLRAIKLQLGEFNLDSIPPDLIIWSAGESLQVDKSADDRNIFGIKPDGSMLPFKIDNFDKDDLGVLTYSTAALIIDRVRDGLLDDDKGELGDIFHSSPLRIHVPNYFYVDQGFDRFYNEMKERSPLVYAGANDGMLHVFADSIKGESGRGGEEITGIIPMNFIPELKRLLSDHSYFVDANPVAADVWFPVGSDDSLKQWNEWHTVLIACQGEGGRSFTAFDVTDPLGETPHLENSIEFLFSAMQSSLLKDTLGYTISTPIIRKIGANWSGHPGRTIDRFFAFMGGGQWPDPMDISLLDDVFSGGNIKGNVIVAFDIWNVVEYGINDNVFIIPPIGRDLGLMNVPFPASPSIINMDPERGNRYDFLFIPDAFGQLWFVDLRNPDPWSWEAECIFTPPIPASSDSSELYIWHPAFYSPFVWKDPVYGDYWIAYGTGNRSDIFSPSQDRFYALKYPAAAIEDPEVAIPVYGEGDLGVPEIPTNAGWMIELQHLNEKVVTEPVYFLDSLKFFTFSPGSEQIQSPCEIGGLSSVARSYAFNIRTGGTAVIGGAVTGAKMPQPARYSFSLDGTGMQISQVSGKIEIKGIRSFGSFREIIKWKEE